MARINLYEETEIKNVHIYTFVIEKFHHFTIVKCSKIFKIAACNSVLQEIKARLLCFVCHLKEKEIPRKESSIPTISTKISRDRDSHTRFKFPSSIDRRRIERFVVYLNPELCRHLITTIV